MTNNYHGSNEITTSGHTAFWHHFHDESTDLNEKYRRFRNIETIDISCQYRYFLQNPGIDSIEYLVSISAHPYIVVKNCMERTCHRSLASLHSYTNIQVVEFDCAG
jgi:hypothetical protein